MVVHSTGINPDTFFLELGVVVQQEKTGGFLEFGCLAMGAFMLLFLSRSTTPHLHVQIG